jgi:hypothetical protein
MTARQRPLDDGLVRRLADDPGDWLSCDDCFRLLDVFVETAVDNRPAADLTPMTNHLRTCQACREEAETLVSLAAVDAGVDEREVLARLYPAST